MILDKCKIANDMVFLHIQKSMTRFLIQNYIQMLDMLSQYKPLFCAKHFQKIQALYLTTCQKIHGDHKAGFVFLCCMPDFHQDLAKQNSYAFHQKISLFEHECYLLLPCNDGSRQAYHDPSH